MRCYRRLAQVVVWAWSTSANGPPFRTGPSRSSRGPEAEPRSTCAFPSGRRTMAKIRVLIIDDHAIVRDGLGMVINPQPDMEVVGEAADGHEALRQAREANPDVLTLDLTMPGGGGLNALERLRQACPQTRVLVLTMHEDPSYLRAALAAGATRHVAKSAVDSDLHAAILSVAQGRTFVTMNLSERGTHQVLADWGTRTASAPRAPVQLVSTREQEALKFLAQGNTN